MKIKKAETTGILAIDTETTGLNVRQDRLVGVSLALREGEACYIPLNHKLTKTQGNLDLGVDNQASDNKAILQLSSSQVLQELKPILENPSILKVGQNIKFDAHIFAQHKIKLSPIDDTMLLSYCLNGGLPPF